MPLTLSMNHAVKDDRARSNPAQVAKTGGRLRLLDQLSRQLDVTISVGSELYGVVGTAGGLADRPVARLNWQFGVVFEFDQIIDNL